ncbi:MAG: class I SAM-dependent methyltransferase [Chloroflexi bacterium]|nr:class I SAM-dependent methyltransferase [Chloroflexota bacterium]
MRPRITFARFLLRLSGFLRTLPVVVMRPADMVEFSRQAYERGSYTYGDLNDPDAGLTGDEMVLWEKVPCRTGRVLVLGGGGGREAITFARQGFEVTGVDFSEGMLARARESMAQRGLDFQGWTGDISQLEAPVESFDVVWISMFLYSVVLGRQRRVEMLRRIRKALKPGGVLVCSFYWDPGARASRKGELLRKAVAWLTLGNTAYENGDILLGTIEFRHAFWAEEDLRAEFAAGGFEVLYLTIFDRMRRGGAVLRKPDSSSLDRDLGAFQMG